MSLGSPAGLLCRCGLLAACVAVSCAATAVAKDGPVQFNRDIRPILSNNCYYCHGPDEKHREAGLRLDRRDSAIVPGESKATAIVPGDVQASELVRRVLSTDPDQLMPPPASGKSLTDKEKATLRRWIEEGAEYQGHWSFIAPKRPEPPAVKAAAAVRNAIDNFIMARLEAEQLAPSSEAERRTLIRRVMLDLTGLPPTPAEVEAFVNDSRPDAYEQLVDRTLNSPRYGEHFGRIWLDAARYGDTHGLHLDNERSMWPYRDWVVNAFNANQRFDQFTIEQIGGDLLPSPSRDQLIATGFNRCNVTTSEGGSIDEEVYVRYAVDRTEAIGTIYMGLTLGCCVCHSHKYDPISQKEFYGLYSFFFSMADNAMDGNALLPPPILKLPTAEQEQRLSELDKQLAGVGQRIADELGKSNYVDPGETPNDASGVAKDFVWIDDDVPAGANPQSNGSPWAWVTKADFPVHLGNRASTRKAPGLDQHFFTGAATKLKIGEGDKLFAHVYLDPNDLPKSIMLQFNDGSWEHRAFWGEDAIPYGAVNTPAKLPMGSLPAAGGWVRLEVEAAKVNLPSGSELNGWAFTQFGGTVYWDAAGIVTKTPQSGQSFESQRAWEAFDKGLAKSTVPDNIRNLVKIEPDKRNEQQQKELRNYFLEHVCGSTRSVFGPLHAERASLTKEKTDLDAAIPATLVSGDRPQMKQAHVLIRGQYNKKGDAVDRQVPAALSPFPADAPLNRLGLARWLVDGNHPLTSRVVVNRLWQQLFGVGLVKTAEDFGLQGQWPSHPELLDWLATEFVQSGWDYKRMVKLMVMSGTYRQSSRVGAELLQRDAANELLARGPRFRLDAEVIRDNALSISGLLVEHAGGRSVKSYQPEGLWEAVAFTSSNTREYKPDNGQSLYRRSLYTFWKRTSPPPSLATFDAPSRENCTVRRPRTNTPMQALALMNDVQYVEAARRFVERMFAEGGATPESRLSYGFQCATGRKPGERELAVLVKVLRAHQATYSEKRDAAATLLAVGASPRDASIDSAEHAAWTMVANLLLNLDETITKE